MTVNSPLPSGYSLITADGTAGQARAIDAAAVAAGVPLSQIRYSPDRGGYVVPTAVATAYGTAPTDPGDPLRYLTAAEVSATYATLAAVPGLATAGASVAAFGDSISGRAEPYLAYASALSGKFRVTDIYSNPGLTSAQLLPLITQVTEATDKPAVCIVLCGANDAGIGVPVATYGANVTAMVAALRAAGIYPVLATCPPQTSTYGRGWAQTYNVWLQRYAAGNRIPLIPFAAVLTGTNGDYIPAYNDDGIHPSPAGLKAMGQAVADSLRFLSTDGLLPAFEGGINLVPNGLFTADSDSDGWPDSWTVAAQTGLAVSLEARTGIAGQVWKITETGTTAAPALNGAAITTGFAPGDRVRIAAWVDSEQAGWNSLQFACFTSDWGTQTGIFNVFSATGLGGFTQPLAGLIQQEIVVPANTGNLLFKWQVGSGTGVYRLGQLGVWNLTQLGLTA